METQILFYFHHTYYTRILPPHLCESTLLFTHYGSNESKKKYVSHE